MCTILQNHVLIKIYENILPCGKYKQYNCRMYICVCGARTNNKQLHTHYLFKNADRLIRVSMYCIRNMTVDDTMFVVFSYYADLF
jgi:hypothetical protein